MSRPIAQWAPPRRFLFETSEPPSYSNLRWFHASSTTRVSRKNRTNRELFLNSSNVLSTSPPPLLTEGTRPLRRTRKGSASMIVHLINPSDKSFGTAVITPRWLYVLAAATPHSFGNAQICDETLEQLDPSRINSGDVVGIGIHTGNALRGYAIGRMARERGAWVVFGGIHATLYPEEALRLGSAHSVVKGDGDVVWAEALKACMNGVPASIYEGGRIESDRFLPARWDLLPDDSYMWASVQTIRGCPQHCSVCSVWRTDGQRPRQRASDGVIGEIVQLRRKGFRFIALADDNFYPVTLTDLQLAERQKNQQKLNELRSIREERFELMACLAELPSDMVFYTQITMEAAEDLEFLEAMRKARIKGALVGVEARYTGRSESRLQGLQLLGRESGSATPDFPSVRHPCPRLVHLWLAYRSAKYVRCDRRTRAAG
jgi:hypothetical protein